jgi:glutathione synthase/RimK-type ligase-like ATP-grasp enzyme
MTAEWVTWAALAALALSPLGRPLSADAARAPRRSALILNGAELAGAKNELGAGEFDVVFRSIDELVFTIEAGAVSVHETATGRDLAEFAFVQVASFPNPTVTLLNAVAAYLRDQGVDAVNAEGIGAPTRLLQYVRFAQAGMPVPASRYLPPLLLATAYPDLADQLGLPFILTPIRGGAGRRDHLVSDEPGFAKLLRAASHAHFLAREFVPADATYHLLVLGQQVSIVMRQGISLSATCRLRFAQKPRISLIDAATFSADARILAVQAASLMGLDVAGVQVVRHWTTGEWYVLATSATPPFSAGAFAPAKVSAYTAYLQRKLGAVTGQDRHPR